MSPGEITETVVGCATGLSLVGALIAREALKHDWVRFSFSIRVIPLEKRGQAPETTTETAPVPIGAGRERDAA